MAGTLKKWLPTGLMATVVVSAAFFGLPASENTACAAEKGKHDAARERLAEISKADQLSGLFRSVAEVMRPAVVEVRVAKRVEQPDMQQFFEPFQDDGNNNNGLPFRFRVPRGRMRPGQPQPRRSVPMNGLGSGVIIDAENGYVVTNAHVVDGVDEVVVVLADGKKLKAEWTRSDPGTDVAVVKVAAENLTAAPLGDSDAVQIGDWVLAFGSPRGLPQTVTSGIISAKGRHVLGLATYQDFIQTDAAINKGNSGGPLVNMRGEVIAINDAIASVSGGNEGIGFAIPSNMVRDVVKQLIEGGKVVRGFLGILPQDLDEKLVKSLKLPSEQGVLVAEVVPDGPAAKAGLQIEDVIVSISGKETRDVNQLRSIVASVRPDETVPVEFYRNGEMQKVEVAIAPQPADLTAGGAEKGKSGEAEKPTGAARYGLSVQTLTKELAEQLRYPVGTAGVVIADVDEGSDAAEQRLAPEMVITHVDGQPVKSADEFAAAAKKAEAAMRLRVISPDGGSRVVLITPQEP